MIAALYARKSTPQEGAAGVSESVERQLDHAAAYIARKGWTPGGPIFYDDNVSGAAYAKLVQRNRMVAEAEAGAFQVLVVSEQSRLGRDMIEVAYTIKRIAESGVRIFSYLDDQEISVEDEVAQAMTFLRSFSSASERRQTSRRVFDAAQRRVRAGQVAGAKIYGYDNVPVPGPGGKPSHTVRRVNPDQAAVVVRIFTMYAEGIGSLIIAHRLNAEGVPAPRVRGWAQAGVKYMLRNELYRGVVIWGRSQNIVRKGRKTNRLRAPKDWERVEAPALRIVDEPLWERVQARRQSRRRSFPRSPSTGRLLGRPSWHDGHSNYLWTGFGRCTVCGDGSIRVTHRRHGTRPNRVIVRSYLCATHDNRGAAQCANDVLVRVEALDRALVAALAEVLDDRLLEAAVGRALAWLQTDQEHVTDRRAHVERDLAQLQHRIDRSLDAFLDGQGAMPELRAKLEADRQRKDALAAELAALTRAVGPASLDAERIKRDLRAYAADVRALLTENVQQGRAALRKLLDGRLIDVEPVTHADGRKGFRFQGVVALNRLLAGEVLTRLTGLTRTDSARPANSEEPTTSGSGTTRGDRCAAAPARAPLACGCRPPGSAWPRAAVA